MEKEFINDVASSAKNELVMMPQWVSVGDRLPARLPGKFGEIELYCKTSCGIEVVTFNDWDQAGKLTPGYFDDDTVTEWLYIPDVTLAS